MVEMTLCGLAFLTLTLGAMDFGWGVYTYNFCSYSAQDAARWASVRGSQSSSPAQVSDIQNFVQSEAVGLTAGLLTVTPCWSGSCPSSGFPPTGDNAPGSPVSVTVQYQIQPLTALGIRRTLTVSSTAQFVISN